MNHRITPSLVATLSAVALAAVVVAGCGQAFSLTGSSSGGGGNGGDAATTASSTATAAASTSDTGATTGSSSASSASAASSTSSGMIVGCGDSSDCTSKEFCEKPSCGGGVLGVCKLAAPTHTPFDPVCGCDGVTYWNSAYAAGTSKAVHHGGACKLGDMPKAKTCAVNSCGGGEQCVSVKGSCRDLIAFSSCWILPNKCEGTSKTEVACNGLQAGECGNLCSIILNQMSFMVVDPACSPP